MVNLFLSGPADFSGSNWGKAHYSYGFVLQSFYNIVKATDNVVDVLSYPFDANTINNINKESNAISISFLPPDVSLLIPGLKNICAFAWEFDKLPKKSIGADPVFQKDYQEVLNQYDSVITLSSYAQNVMANYGIKSHVLPTAVSKRKVLDEESIDNLKCYLLSTVPDFYNSSDPVSLKTVLDNSSYEKRFLYILNPHDMRKNFGNLVMAFSKFRINNPDAALILKMSFQKSLESIQKARINNELVYALNNTFDGVYILQERLDDSKLQMLMDSCQNYVSPSRAEGQNLPLCEAMISGMVCITPDHTSMADYVTKDSAIVLESKPMLVDETNHNSKYFYGLGWFDVNQDSIFDGLNRAMLLTTEDKGVMLNKAKQNIENFCSIDAISKKWSEIKLQLKVE